MNSKATDRYNITTNDHLIPVAPLDRLAVLFVDLQRVSAENGEDLASLIHYFWISNTIGILSNSTVTILNDGKAHITDNYTI